MIDARAWLIWALVGMVAALSTRNPLYLVVLLLVATIVDRATAPLRVRVLPFRPLPLTAIAVGGGALLNALAAHTGETTLLRLPDWLPLIGGPITLEALVWGGTSGLALGSIYALFCVFNQVTAVRDLIGLAPRAFHELALVLSVALTFVPETTRALARVREAQAIRGHAVHGIRDWVPIVVPLTIGALERSIALAETVVARGYGAGSDRLQPPRRQAVLLGGAGLALAAWLIGLLIPDMVVPAVIAAGVGASLVGAALWAAGRAAPRTTYRRRRLGRLDWSIAVASALGLVGLLAPDAFYYSPYPLAALPPFEPAAGVPLLALLAPAVALWR